MPIDPHALGEISSAATGAGAGGVVGALIAFAQKYLLDKKIQENHEKAEKKIDKMKDEHDQLKLHLANNFFKKDDILDIVKELKADNAITNKKLDQVLMEIIDMKIELAGWSKKNPHNSGDS